ncbi:MAG: hypothetical protein K0Q68_303 [Moraxellaceae bacterium]|jgi:hypothetical protein|nr:hypothetical protein [Moraxellaceae bacterium]
MKLRSPAPGLIPDGLWQAYADTVFVFRDHEAIGVIRVGQRPDGVTARLLERSAVSAAVFITAYNPQHGPDLAPEHNLDRQRSLRLQLQNRGFRYCGGAGLGTDTAWDPEASLLVLGVTESNAIQLGREFGQNAVVWIEANREVRLLVSH